MVKNNIIEQDFWSSCSASDLQCLDRAPDFFFAFSVLIFEEKMWNPCFKRGKMCYIKLRVLLLLVADNTVEYFRD